jgi:hypothetical protein
MKILLTAWFVLTFACLATAQNLEVPGNLRAEWEEGTGTTRTIRLEWADVAGETGYSVQRKIGAATTWTTLVTLPTDTAVYSDTTIPRGTATASANMLYYRYRIQSLNGTAKSGYSEITTMGRPHYWGAEFYDTDADGIADDADASSGLWVNDGTYYPDGPQGTALQVFNSWADGTGDLDGDSIPNAWESNLGTTMLVENSILDFGVAMVTVDPTYTGTDTATLTKTISGAITKLGTGSATKPPYRIIWVKPGIYRENLNFNGNHHVALIADRSGPNPKMECEIQGVTNDPVISAAGSLVMDGFVITRSAGSKGAAISISETHLPTTRLYLTRITNCIVRNMDNGSEPIVKQYRGRLVLSHCSFYMNSVDDSALAHSYTTGPLTTSGTAALQFVESTALMHAENCIFWNPINTLRPELDPGSVGKIRFSHSIVYGPGGPDGTDNINPGLTPKGYLASNGSAANLLGKPNDHVKYDIFGSERLYDVNYPDYYAIGAHYWVDSDADGIPDFADLVPDSVANAGRDLDQDGISEAEEYLAGTSVNSADYRYLTLESANRLFAKPEEYLTRAEADSLYVPLGSTPLRIIRVAPGGNIGMMQTGSPPAP